MNKYQCKNLLLLLLKQTIRLIQKNPTLKFLVLGYTRKHPLLCQRLRTIMVDSSNNSLKPKMSKRLLCQEQPLSTLRVYGYLKAAINAQIQAQEQA